MARWTLCGCGHLAQDHDDTSMCVVEGCPCDEYTGEMLPEKIHHAIMTSTEGRRLKFTFTLMGDGTYIISEIKEMVE